MKTEENSVTIKGRGVELEGILNLPLNTKSLVLFVHGSGSSRFSPRNRYVAEVIQQKGIGTLLFDLLTEKEEREDIVTLEYRFDIQLLTERVVGVTEWVSRENSLRDLSFGYFGASTGAAAALNAAAFFGEKIKAVVSRGGRPDLADSTGLSKLISPTLLIVGQNDKAVIQMNKNAMEKISSQTELYIVPGAAHLFEEPGTLEEAAGKASDWFKRFLL